MVEESEARVKMGVDNSEVSKNLRNTVQKFEDMGKSIKHEFHGIKMGFRSLSMVMHGFGAFAAIGALAHIGHFVIELFSSWEKAVEEAKKRIKELEHEAEKMDDKRGEISKKREQNKVDQMTPGEKVDFHETRGEELSRQTDSAKKVMTESRQIYESTKERWGKDDVRTKEAQDTFLQQQIKYQEALLEYEENRKQMLKSSNEVRKEMDSDADKDTREKEEDERKRVSELHRLKMFHMDEERIKKNLLYEIDKMQGAELNKYLPTAKEILESGVFRSRGGRWRQSEAFGLQRQLDSLMPIIKQERARFGLDSKTLGDIKYAESLQEQLDKFLGKGDTVQDKIADATSKAEEHLKEIRAAFYNEEDE